MRAEDQAAAKLKVDTANRIIAAIDTCRSQPERIKTVVQSIGAWKQRMIPR
jgi:hypothetical protein